MKECFSVNTGDVFFHHSYDKKPKSNKFRMHTHAQCELYCFLKGKGSFYVEGTRYVLQPGDVLFMNSAESHYIDIAEDACYERCALQFRKDYIRRIDPEGKLLSPFEDRPFGKNNLLRKSDFPDDGFMTVLERILVGGDDRELRVRSNVFPLLCELRRAFKSGKDASNTPNETRIQRIIGYINLHLAEPLSLDMICEEFYISKAQLCRLFKHATGSTVWEYITIKRLVMAQQLMRSGVAPTQACARCGYNDYSVFYRIYQKHFGHSPKIDHCKEAEQRQTGE
ncbi:MAG: helix-turn-helix transcriptional regulator [Oscillospiraceae bacterium]|nr:helix-turn-helix transcriptional regulator [Oscillospiraceae bacterium]